MRNLLCVMPLLFVLFAPTNGRAEEVNLRDVSGLYVRETENERATLNVTQLPEGKVHVQGIVTAADQSSARPVVRALDFHTEIMNGKIDYVDAKVSGEKYRLELIFDDRSLSAHEEGSSVNIGLGFDFRGRYNKH